MCHPGGSIRTQAQLALQLQRRDAIGVRRHQKRSPEPDRQRLLAGVHDRARGHRGLLLTRVFLFRTLNLDDPDARA